MNEPVAGVSPALRFLSRSLGCLRVGSLLALLMLAGGAAARPAALMGIPLQDHHGRWLDEAAYAGQVLVLNFVYTGCSTTCPVQTTELAALRRALPADVRARTRFLSVTVDPENDTPQTMAAYARARDADMPGWAFASGAPRDVFRFVERMQVLDLRQQPPAPDSHRTSVYLYDRSGALVQRYLGVPLDRARLLDEISQVARATR